MKNIITVLLADDHAMVRAGLHSLINTESDIEVIGEAENGREAVEMATSLNPDIIIMDIAMPTLNGFEATRQIIKSTPAAKIFILSAHGDDAYVEQAMTIGASGFLIKQSAAHILPVAIRQIYNGSEFFSPTISRRLLQQQHRDQQRGDDNTPQLSSREMEVLQLVAEGKANKQTADELNISIKTVEKHRQSLMDKLNIHDTAGLTRYAIAAGVIESSVQVTIIE
ncbi:MAG: DNA-binding NarL/FixJ family response regulator [Cryomorphaceae bacterium]|jgi:DNA-binding NarL/FixJ family response regulator